MSRRWGRPATTMPTPDQRRAQRAAKVGRPIALTPAQVQLLTYLWRAGVRPPEAEALTGVPAEQYRQTMKNRGLQLGDSESIEQAEEARSVARRLRDAAG